MIKANVGSFFSHFEASFQSGFFEREFGLQFKNFLRIRDEGILTFGVRVFGYYDYFLHRLKS